MTFEEWWAKHEPMFSDPKQAASAAWHARRPPGRVPIPDPDYPDDVSKTMWCELCVAAVACPHCGSPAGVPCRGALFMSNGHANGKRYILTVHHRRRDAHIAKKREQP